MKFNRSHRAGRPSLSLFRLLAAFAVVATTLVASPSVSPVGAQDAEVRDIHLPVPVETVFGGYGDGGVRWSDTWGACRGSGCSRSHEGVDLLGPKLTPLLAANDGYISWMRLDTGRGNNLVITDDDGWQYHYIHINNDSPGTDDGANPVEHAFSSRIATAWENGTWQGLRVTAGELVAYMGDSGNAESCCSHLHFEIVNPAGANINPTPSVDAALAFSRANPQGIEVDPSLLGPYEDFAALGSDLFRTLTGRSATTSELLDLRATLEADGFAAALAPFVDNNSQSADIDRLYVAYFDRLPDYEGYEYWHGRLSNGWNIQTTSRFFAGSDEAVATYGDATLQEFIDILYSVVLGRSADAGGREYWLDRLENDEGIDRANIVAFFTDSAELRNKTEYRSEIVALSALFANRMPTQIEIDAWLSLRSSGSLQAALSATFDPNS